MKIFIVSFFFPPYNTPGSVRTGKLAKELVAAGHEVRVLCAKEPTLFGEVLSEGLSLEVSEDHVTRAPWKDVSKIPRKIAALLPQAAGKAEGGGSKTKSILRSSLFWPDERMGWFHPAVREGLRLLERWHADLIYASGLPATVLLVGRELAKRCGIPWAAEFRDLWADSNYYPNQGWRQWVDRWWETRVLRDAVGLVTVSEPLKKILLERHGLDTMVVRNGFDPDDFPARKARALSSEFPLTITYTGSLYGGRRDPKLLFEAMRSLKSAARQFRLRFFVAPSCGSYLRSLSARYGIESQLEICDLVSFERSIQIQCESDILLLLLGSSAGSEGVFTSKVFEYLGARRPVLVLGGSLSNVASKLIRDRRAGVHLNSAADVEVQLRQWAEQKSNNQLGPLDPSVMAGLTRREQVRELVAFFEKCLRV